MKLLFLLLLCVLYLNQREVRLVRLKEWRYWRWGKNILEANAYLYTKKKAFISGRGGYAPLHPPPRSASGFHGLSSIPTASSVELLYKNISRYSKHRIVCSSHHHGTFNPSVLTNKEVHMVHDNINKNDEASHTTSNAKRSLNLSDHLSKKMKNGKPLSGEQTPHCFCYFFLNLFLLNYL